jgi:xylulokinase
MLLGLDIGTSSAKAVLLDENGRTAAEASAAYAVDAPRPGWAETAAEKWWQAIVEAAHRLPRELRAQVRGIGLSGQMHSVVLADARGTALRPAILWLDNRSADCLQRYPAGSELRTGNPISAGMTGPTLLWLAAHEKETLRAARWALQPKDWLRLRLTDIAATEPSDSTGTLLADHYGNWDDILIDALGIARQLLPPVIGSAQESGHLTKAAAQALDLPPGIPIAGGAGDTLAAAFGSGLYADRAAQLSIGSSAQIMVVEANWSGYSPHLNNYRNANPGDLPRWCLMAAMLNAGVALEWARGILRLTWDEVYELAFTAQAAQSRTLFLPYVTGERTPWMNPNVRGAWVGLSPSDDPGSLMRAALVGVAFAIRAGLDALREHGLRIERLRLVGGGSVHARWRRLLVDVLGVPLDAVTCANASARGAALLGGLAAGCWTTNDLPTLAPAAVPAGEPSNDNFAESYARFRDLYARLAGWFEPVTPAQPHVEGTSP